jgi:hypothetical protein
MSLFLRGIMALKQLALQSKRHAPARRACYLPAAGMILLGIVLAGCGQSTSAGTAQGGVPTGGTATSSRFLTDQNSAIDATVGGLHIHSDGLLCDQESVLATARLNYDTAEIRQMRAYFNKVFTGFLSHSSAGTPPTTLRLVNTGLGCNADLQITNTSTSAVEIVRAGVKVLAGPVRNTYQYHFVDVCSIGVQTGPYGCPPALGGTPQCSTFQASVLLSTDMAGELAEGNVTPLDVPPPQGPCPAEPPLNPGDSIDVYLNPISTGSAANLIYSVELALTIKTTSGQQTLLVPQPQSHLVFANVNQYSCYKLQGAAFELKVRGQHALGFWETWCA